MPGNLNKDGDSTNQNEDQTNSNKTNDEDLQEDEDEKVTRKAKQASENRKFKLHQYLQEHSEHDTSMFEKPSSSSTKDALLPAVSSMKGLHIEDIGKDIQKIHDLLVDTAETDQSLDQTFASSPPSEESILNAKRQHSLLSPHNSASTSSKVNSNKKKKPANGFSAKAKAQVSDPARPVYATSNQV